MPTYDTMLAQMRQERLERIGRRVIEASFEDEMGNCLGFPGRWKEATCKEKPQLAHAKATASGDGVVLVTILGEENPHLLERFLTSLPDEVLFNLENFQWYPRNPLPPLVVLAKCAAGNLASDRASKEWPEE